MICYLCWPCDCSSLPLVYLFSLGSSLLLVCSCSCWSELTQSLTQAPARLLILQMAQDPARVSSSSSPLMAIHVQVWGSHSRLAINQKTTLHTECCLYQHTMAIARKQKLCKRQKCALILLVLFFANLWASTPSRPINTQKKNSVNIQPSWPRTWSITYIYHIRTLVVKLCFSTNFCQCGIWERWKLQYDSKKFSWSYRLSLPSPN